MEGGERCFCGDRSVTPWGQMCHPRGQWWLRSARGSEGAGVAVGDGNNFGFRCRGAAGTESQRWGRRCVLRHLPGFCPHCPATRSGDAGFGTRLSQPEEPTPIRGCRPSAFRKRPPVLGVPDWHRAPCVSPSPLPGTESETRWGRPEPRGSDPPELCPLPRGVGGRTAQRSGVWRRRGGGFRCGAPRPQSSAQRFVPGTSSGAGWEMPGAKRSGRSERCPTGRAGGGAGGAEPVRVCVCVVCAYMWMCACGCVCRVPPSSHPTPGEGRDGGEGGSDGSPRSGSPSRSSNVREVINNQLGGSMKLIYRRAGAAEPHGARPPASPP